MDHVALPQRSAFPALLRPIIVAALGTMIVLCGDPRFVTAAEPPPLPAFRIVETDTLRFGMFGDKPPQPAPTLFVLVGRLETCDEIRLYSETGRLLAAQGWLVVSVELPCHGKDARAGEPGELKGWAHRVKAGEDWLGPFTERCRKTLDHLVAEKFTDPARVALNGTSRGGFCALHFAAADPRVRVVTCVSPVTNPLALSEFAGVTTEKVAAITATTLAERLAGRAVQFTIGNDDARVGADDCIATARRLAAAGRQARKPPQVVPVEILIGPSDGHRAVDGAYAIAADFILRQTK